MKKVSKLKKIAAIGSVLILIAVKLLSGKSDSRIRESVVMIKSSYGQCSGIQIQAHSGQSYILTAGHCAPLSEDKLSLPVITEDGRHLVRKIVAEDPVSDLLLVEGVPGLPSLSLAEASHRFEEIRTFTHGRGHDTYQTHGIIVDDRPAQAFMGDAASCPKQPKFKVMESIFGPLCILDVQETTITAPIVPGSSGGAIVDPRGDLVGIASMGGDGLFYMVRLQDIKAFTQNY